MSLAAIVARASARKLAVQLAVEHAGTRQQRREAKEQASKALKDSPINTSGPVEVEAAGWLGLEL